MVLPGYDSLKKQALRLKTSLNEKGHHVKLSQAQESLAVSYGFANWNDLLKATEKRRDLGEDDDSNAALSDFFLRTFGLAGTVVGHMDPEEQEIHFVHKVSRSAQEALGNILEDMDAGDEGAVRKLEALCAKYPGFIEAHNGMAVWLYERGYDEEATGRWGEACFLALQGLLEGLIQHGYKIPYGDLGNRPFLRVYHSIGLALLRKSNFEAATKIFEALLKFNPNDNQGLRFLLPACYLEIRKPKKVLALVRKSEEEVASPYHLYSAVLAYLQLGDAVSARKAMEKAYQEFPRVAKELIKTDHPLPGDYNSHGVSHQSANEAYHYWHDCGHFWTQTPGAQPLLRAVVEETTPGFPHGTNPVPLLHSWMRLHNLAPVKAVVVERVPGESFTFAAEAPIPDNILGSFLRIMGEKANVITGEQAKPYLDKA